MSNRKMNGSDFGEWFLIVLMLCVFWPVGVFLLFRKLMGYRKKSGGGQGAARTSGGYNAQYEYHYAGDSLKKQQSRTTAQGKQGAGVSAPGGVSRSGRTKGKLMTWIGGGIAALFGVVGISEFLGYLSWGGLSYAWSELFVLFGFCVAGLVVMYAGLSRTRKGRRFQKYLNTIGRQKKISVSVLANATGYSVRKVCDDLDEMLETGILPVGYLDRASGMLILSDEGAQEAPKQEPVRTEQSEYAILQEIQSVNDAIPDAVMSAKIDRIAFITRKILDYQKKNPGRDAELRSFLDYYLPTTLKILRAYAQLDAQGVSGENINSAKARIEGMMDKVVDGFEKQLDRLFQTDTMDIASDVQVLEQMLKKDGLSGDDGFELKL